MQSSPGDARSLQCDSGFEFAPLAAGGRRD
jgi:hypothetical protein